MWNNKFLVVITATFLISGLGFIFLSLQPVFQKPKSSPNPVPIIKNVQGLQGERGLVTKVIDGDTFEVQIDGNNFKVRLVGIDTPETVDPRRSVGCFGKQASSEVKDLLSGKEVILQKDISDTDKYKRLLRYVYLPLENGNLLFVNDYLVREGFAKVYTYPPDVKFNKQFLEAQQFARENKKGLWGSC